MEKRMVIHVRFPNEVSAFELQSFDQLYRKLESEDNDERGEARKTIQRIKRLPCFELGTLRGNWEDLHLEEIASIIEKAEKLPGKEEMYRMLRLIQSEFREELQLFFDKHDGEEFWVLRW